MPYYSHATIMGHLGRDVESKSLPSGKELHEFSVAVTDKRGRVRGYTANGVPTYFEGLRGSDQRACWRYVANGEEVPAAEQPYINAPNNLRTLDPARSRSASACREGYAIVHFSARDGSVLAVGEPHAPVDALVTSLSGACLKSLWGAAV